MGNKEKDNSVNQDIEDLGEVSYKDSKKRIHVMTIIGEIEGHDNLAAGSKTTKYEHVLPKLAAIEEDEECKGLLLIINTVGGDVSAGLALAEMVASLSKPTVALVIGDCHSIGVPLAVSCDYSFIVPSGTMIIHPVRMSGTVIGAPQTYEYFKIIQDRIVGFIEKHSRTTASNVEKMMMKKGVLTKDLGTILVGAEAVENGLINQVGGIGAAFEKINELINE